MGYRKIWKEDGKLNIMFSARKLPSKNVCVCVVCGVCVCVVCVWCVCVCVCVCARALAYACGELVTGFLLFISWERITTHASPNGIPRDIYSTYVQT